MANTTYVLTFQTPLGIATYPVKDTSMPFEEIRSLRNFVQRIESGALAASFTAQTSTSAPVNASGTLTLTYASISNNDTCIIGLTTLTCVTGTPSGGAQFKKVTDATATAANLVACVNANTTLNKYCYAANTAGVVTITALVPGTIGNLIALTGSTGMVASATYLASGAGGAETVAVTYHKGV